MKTGYVICFDFGLRQIGVATGNTLVETTQPLDVLGAKDGVPDWQALEKLVKEWRPDLLVVGDPLNMDGSESELCLRARKFARRLEGRLGISVETVRAYLKTIRIKLSATTRTAVVHRVHEMFEGDPLARV